MSFDFSMGEEGKDGMLEKRDSKSRIFVSKFVFDGGKADEVCDDIDRMDQRRHLRG